RVPRRVERNDLLDDQRLALGERGLELLGYILLLLDPVPGGIDSAGADERARASGDRDAKIGLARAHREADAFVAGRAAGDRLEVTVIERPVELRPVVHDASVERRAERHVAGP